MGGLPKKGLEHSKLKFLTIGSVDGSHQISKVTFIEDSIEKQGFYKELAPEKDYPELLAKMDVAASIFKRLFQGEKSAEVRLVFDKNEKIVGTLSINMEGFKPFNFSNELVPKDQNQKELVIPSTETLYKANIMEMLLARWFLGDDDGHPHNMSLAGDIDFDMFWYWFTYIMKGGARTGLGEPKHTRIDLTVKAFESFPSIEEPYHWCTYNFPGEGPLGDMVYIVGKMLPKAFADPKQFKDLSKDARAQEQKLAAALKALLTFQPKMVRARLEQHFGDMPLNYTSLDEKMSTIYEEKFPRFCSSKTDKESFINFIMKMYQEHYDNLYRVVAFYMGCENNGYGVPLPPTYFAIYRKPSYYKNIKEWVLNQNDTLYKDEDENIKYNEQELEQRYHQFWRDAFAPSLKELLHSAYNLTNKVLHIASKNGSLVEVEGKKTTDISITNALEIFGQIPELSKEKIEPLIGVEGDSSLREALLLLIEFTNKLNTATKAYYEKEHNKLTEEDNCNFVGQIDELYKKYNLKIRQKLAHTSTEAKEFNRIASGLKLFAEQADFQLHLTTTDELMKDVSITTISEEILPHTDEKVIKQFNKALFSWAKSVKPDEFNRLITEIIESKYESKISFRNRGKPVKEYLKASLKDSGDNRLAYILSSGNEEEGALNSLLIQHLTPHMLQTQFLPSIRNAVNKEGAFVTDLPIFVKSAVHFAKYDEQFDHLCSLRPVVSKKISLIKEDVEYSRDKAIYKFCQTLFEWVDSLSPTQFEGLKEAALKEYISQSWWGSRSSEIEKYKASSQSGTVAMIFAGGKSSSSLNDILFQKIVTAIKTDISKSEKMQEMSGYKLIAQFDNSDDKYNQKNKAFFIAAVRSYAVELTQNQENTISFVL